MLFFVALIWGISWGVWSERNDWSIVKGMLVAEISFIPVLAIGYYMGAM